MSFRTIKNLYKKEILDVLRDKKTVLMMLVVPLIIYPLIFLFSMQIAASFTTNMSEQVYNIVLDFEDEGVLKNMFSDSDAAGYKFNVVESDAPDALLNSGEINAYITKNEKEGKTYYQIYYMSAITNSNYATSYIKGVLAEYSSKLTKGFIEDAGLDYESVINPIGVELKDMSTSEESAGSLLGNLIPFMLIVSLIMGTMYPAIDTTAGERERGTLETVLTLPVTNTELIFSKFLTVATIGVVSAMLNIMSMSGIGIYMYNTMVNYAGMSSINMSQFIPAIIISVLCVLAFAVFLSAITMCVCAFAKSYKEANNYISPLMIVIIFASFISVIPNMELTKHMALVPAANICLLIRDLLIFKYDTGIILLVLASNIVYGIIAVMLLGRIYNSEAVLFGDDGSSVQIFEKRSNLKKGGVPTMGDGILVAALTAVLMLYVGGSLQLKYGYYGVLGTQLIILLVPLAFALYSKKSLKGTYKLNTVKISKLTGGIFMIIGAILVGILLTSVTSSIFKTSGQNMAENMEGLLGDTFIETLLIVAVAPAICEELMFRGYLLSSVEKKMNYKKAVLFVALVFGIYHMSIVQFFTTAFLGTVMGYAVYKSGSIVTSMVMHFINNASSCILMYYPNTVGKIFPIFAKTQINLLELAVLVLIGIVFIWIGKKLVDKDYTINKLSEE